MVLMLIFQILLSIAVEDTLSIRRMNMEYCCSKLLKKVTDKY